MRSGKVLVGMVRVGTFCLSQWSLTFEVRKSTEASRGGPELAASQWSLTFEVRKRPTPCSPRPEPPSRNGA